MAQVVIIHVLAKSGFSNEKWRATILIDLGR